MFPVSQATLYMPGMLFTDITTIHQPGTWKEWMEHSECIEGNLMQRPGAQENKMTTKGNGEPPRV